MHGLVEYYWCTAHIILIHYILPLNLIPTLYACAHTYSCASAVTFSREMVGEGNRIKVDVVDNSSLIYFINRFPKRREKLRCN